MIYIDFEGKTPVNTPADSAIAGWQPWTERKWDSWLLKSQEYHDKLVELHGSGSATEIMVRNEYIDSKSAHWGKLKLWLQVLSHGKCWFSEVRELYSHYDVEHFRPKKIAKGITKESDRDGYWWLAFEYTNYRLCGNVGNRKKGGWFPLKEGSLVSRYGDCCEESEEQYFLDPTVHYDVLLVAFDESGDMIPTPGCSEWEIRRVEETQNRLKLNEHELLAEERRKIWQQMSILIERYLKVKSQCSRGNNPYARGKLEEIIRHIIAMLDVSSELSAVAKWCLLLRNEPTLLKLVA